MPLLVVPLAAGEVDLLTLGEWEDLTRCSKVLFEQPQHPLIERLRSAGVDAAPFDDEPAARDEGYGFVVDPRSPRLLELAHAGARVSSGPAHPPDALTAAHAAPVVRRAAASLADLTSVMARLRSNDGCPWDQQQTHESLMRHLTEEANEVIEAIEHGTLGVELEEELGDVLLQVAFHARLADEESRFDLAGVADAVVAKLVHRHPHVFADTTVADAREVKRNWEKLKAGEKERLPHYRRWS